MLNKTLVGVLALAVIAAAFVCTNMAKAREPITDGLVSYWTFEGNAKDIWGNNHGTFEGNPQVVDGKVGKALKFDGRNDFIKVPDSDSLDITDEITVEAWVKPDKASGYGTSFRTIVAKDKHASQPYGFYWDNQNAELEFVVNDASDRLTVPCGYDEWVGTWVHLAATYDGEAIKIYMDGEVIGSRQYGGELVVDDASLCIGWDCDAKSDRYFPCTIDELRIYNRALDEDEIKHNLGAGKLAVENPADKLACIWGDIKVSR